MPEAAANPYPGPRSFEEGDRPGFFGRESETRQILALAVARRVVLLYSPSGGGKTSLLQAGVLPRLRAMREVTVLPIARVGGAPPPGVEPGNVYALSTLTYLLGDEVPPGEAAGLTLAGGLERCLAREPEGDRSRPHFLVLDQFEELFTAHPERYPEREAFLHQLRDALLRHPQLTLLLSMRDDYLAHLDPHRALFLDHLRCRFRLELLAEEAALAAMVEPARASGAAFHEDAARRLLDDLRTIRVQAVDGSTRECPGPWVEPVQLQVVCHRLWERRPEGVREIDAAQVEALGDVDQALAGFYAAKVAAAAEVAGVPERAVRDWVDSHLITAGGLRGQVPREPERTQGLDNRAVHALVASHLLRAEERRGVTWFELAHDRLIEPVRADNAAWRAAHLSAVETQAALWEREGRPEGLLLRGEALAAGERWAAGRDNALPAAERDFLAACRRERERARRELFRTRRLQLYAAAATVCLLLAAAAFLQARAERNRAEVQELAARSMAARNQLLDQSLRLALEVDRLGDAVEASRLLAAGLEASPRLEALLPGNGGDVRGLAWSPDGRTLAAAGAGGAVRLWDVAARRPAGPPLAGPPGAVWSVDWSPDGLTLAAGGEGSGVLLWDLREREAAPPQPRRLAVPFGNTIYAVRFSPGGKTLAAVTSGNEVLRWDVATGELQGAPLTGPSDWVTCLVWSPDGAVLAAGGMDRTIHRWDAASGRALGAPLAGHREGVTDLSWSPDGRTLASASLDGTALLWDAATGERRGPPVSLLGIAAKAVAFAPGGRLLAVGGLDGGVLLWDLQEMQPFAPPFTGQQASLHRLAWSPDGTLLASGNGPVVALWSPGTGPRLARSFRLPLDEVTALAAGPDGRTLAAAGRDPARHAPAVLRLDVETGVPLGPPLHGHGNRTAALAWGSGGRALTVAGLDRSLHSWDLAAGHSWTMPLAGSGDRSTSLAFRPDGVALASGEEDGSVLLREAATGQLIHSPLRGHGGSVTALAWSPDGRTLASGGLDGAVRLWDARTRRLLGSPAADHDAEVSALAWGPGGRTLASANSDGTLTLRDGATGRPLGVPLSGPGLPVVALAFSPDGRILASADRERRLWLWDTEARAPLAGPLTGHPGAVSALAFLPGGRTLLSVSLDGTLLVWDADPGSWRELARRLAGL